MNYIKYTSAFWKKNCIEVRGFFFFKLRLDSFVPKDYSVQR